MKKIFIFFLFLIATVSYGQQFVYKPVNPMFGGDTFNYQQLLASANAQNSFTDPNADTRNSSELDQFSESLNRQILGQLSRGFFNDQLSNGLEAGTYNFGTLSIEIFDSLEGLVINILDINTGEQTQIVIPN